MNAINKISFILLSIYNATKTSLNSMDHPLHYRIPDTGFINSQPLSEDAIIFLYLCTYWYHRYIHSRPAYKFKYLERMAIERNDRDIELLKNNPKELIVSLQNLIEIIINQFVKLGKFAYGDKQDIKQQINEELLKKIHRIQKQFNYQSMVRTYMTVAIRNICTDFCRSKKNKIKFILDDNPIIKDNTNILNSIIINEEIQRLQNVINLYHKQKYKILLCLKLYYRMSFEFDDFLLIDNSIQFEAYENFINSIKPYQECNDYTIYNSLIGIFNKIEKKKNKPDALRKWMLLKINELISLLNGNVHVCYYTKESFQVLFEYCYSSDNNSLSSKMN